MLLSQALKLVAASLVVNKSQMVSVDRYALQEVLSDREAQIAALGQTKSSLSNAENQIDKLAVQIKDERTAQNKLKTELEKLQAELEALSAPAA